MITISYGIFPILVHFCEYWDVQHTVLKTLGDQNLLILVKHWHEPLDTFQDFRYRHALATEKMLFFPMFLADI